MEFGNFLSGDILEFCRGVKALSSSTKTFQIWIVSSVIFDLPYSEHVKFSEAMPEVFLTLNSSKGRFSVTVESV